MKLESFGNYIIQTQRETWQQVDVYQAFDQQARRPVIIKLLQLSATTEAGRRLMERLRKSITLSHPYIARVYEVGVVNDRPFLAMEALDDRTLADELAQLRTLNATPTLAPIARQLHLIAAALDYAHTQGLVHGQLNAHNILLTDVDEPILTDFGLTMDYPGDKFNDLYALGSILYEWLTGRPPFESGSPTPQPIADLTAAIQTVILKALAQKPDLHYTSAHELSTAFTSALAEMPLEKQVVSSYQIPQMIGRYQIEAELGWRGNLIVYRAYDVKLERQVAIKILSPHFVNSQEFRTRFKKEIELIATLEHRSVVKVYDFGEYENRPYVVMPYLDGGTLETRLHTDGPLKLDLLAPIIERIGTALDEAHAQGIIHAQIMPSNILFDGQGQAYVSDFSIFAMSETWTDLSDQVNASKASKYMSPEQVQALIAGEQARLDARSDVYALGIVIFEALTGQVPYQANTPYETALAHLESPIPLLHQINPDLPPEYQRIIEKTLAKQPQNRYSTAGTLVARLKDIQSGRWSQSHIFDLIDEGVLIPTTVPDVAATPPDPPIVPAPSGKKFGRFHLEGELGRGGMGVVHLAYDPALKRQVAIKVLPRHLANTPNLRDRFQHEAKLIARLDHDRIVPVYDFGEHDDQLFIVMRYLPGGTLAEKLAQRALKLREIVPTIERVAEALDAAHAGHIIHYDVKPGNILFNAKGDSFLSDFGIAVIREITTRELTKNVAGTPKYMSPEQVKAIMNKTDRSELDGRSDIYALGVVLFEMLTGQVPYQAGTPRETALAHLTETVPDISKIKPNLPASWREVMDRALAKEPTERYQTARELAQDVKELTSGRWLLRQLSKSVF